MTPRTQNPFPIEDSDLDSANIAEYSASHPKINSGFYGDTQDDDPYFKDDSIPARDEDFAGTKELMAEMLKDAIDQGLPKHLHTQASNLINEYSDIFRSKRDQMLQRIFPL